MEEEILRDTPVITEKRSRCLKNYTVGWICALEVEMTAARLVLDKEHEQLPTPPSDDNCYVFGEIGGHNIVISCLPAGIYGKSSAAMVAANMATTFRDISTCLLVGVGGGVPHQSGNDIQLGDVVVGIPTSEHPAVIQYDYGKKTTNGFELKGSLDKPSPALLKAVATLRSKHRLSPSRMTAIMAEGLRKYPQAQEFVYPSVTKDNCKQPESQHDSAHRQTRDDTVPRIFYGSIASGDQVIKDRHVRDQIAQEHGILCFEMEAAGLMDELHALVIRGISDYCDALKNKEFQPYAAFTAAAYAKELLLTMPIRVTYIPSAIPVFDLTTNHRDKIMKLLKFQAFDDRRANVKRAHAQTCRWMLDQQEFLDWLKPNRTGLAILWLKGKPGTGKSTVMKFLHEYVTRGQQQVSITIVFFFNARGGTMEKSTIGMYRSLLFQLLSCAPDLQYILDSLSVDNSADFNLNQLVDLFRQAVTCLGSRQLTCFIDALDECPEDEVWGMIQAFEELADSADEHQIRLRILFSSRHYPNITINAGNYLVLERLHGHANDLKKYLDAELKIGDTDLAKEIKKEVLDRSSGIFLWVVLVVSILRRTYAKGRVHDLRTRLNEIPHKLDELFRDLLLRDNENLPDLLRCLQWLLHSRRPLRREELYVALLTKNMDTSSKGFLKNTNAKNMHDMILDCSKGLVELTQSSTPIVQFIHESVREFLLTPGILTDLHSSFEAASADTSHHFLQVFCCVQLAHTTTLRYGSSEFPGKAERYIYQWYPLTNYAAQHVLDHANLARQGQHIQFIKTFNINLWQWVRRVYGIESYGTFYDHLIEHDLDQLLEAWWYLHPVKDDEIYEICATLLKYDDSEGFKVALTAYLRSVGVTITDIEQINPLLEVLFDYERGYLQQSQSWRDLFLLVLHWHQHKPATALNKALTVAAFCKRESALRLLIGQGAVPRFEDVIILVSQFTGYTLTETSIEMFIQKGRQHAKVKSTNHKLAHQEGLLLESLACVKLLLRNIELSQILNEQISLALYQAIEWTDVSIVSELIDTFSSILVHSSSMNSALRLAILFNKADITRLLLQHGAMLSNLSLHLARNSAMTDAFLQAGVDINIHDYRGDTALHLAVRAEKVHLIKLLLSRHAHVNIQNNKGRTPLFVAMKSGNPLVISELVRKGARVDIADHERNTCLHIAAHYGHRNIVKLLIHAGAYVNFKNRYGHTPLHSISYGPYGQQGSDILFSSAKILYNHGADAVMPPRLLQSSSLWDKFRAIIQRLQSCERPDICCELAHRRRRSPETLVISPSKASKQTVDMRTRASSTTLTASSMSSAKGL